MDEPDSTEHESAAPRVAGRGFGLTARTGLRCPDCGRDLLYILEVDTPDAPGRVKSYTARACMGCGASRMTSEVSGG